MCYYKKCAVNQYSNVQNIHLRALENKTQHRLGLKCSPYNFKPLFKR